MKTLTELLVIMAVVSLCLGIPANADTIQQGETIKVLDTIPCKIERQANIVDATCIFFVKEDGNIYIAVNVKGKTVLIKQILRRRKEGEIFL